MSCSYCSRVATTGPSWPHLGLQCVPVADVRPGEVVLHPDTDGSGYVLIQSREPWPRRVFTCPACKKERTL